MSHGWYPLAIAAEVGSLAAFVLLHHRLLRAGGVRVGVRRVALVTLAADAIHLGLPGGAALSAAYAYRRRREMGASAPVAGWSLASGGVASSGALALVALTGGLFLDRPTTAVEIALKLISVLALALGLAVVTHRPDVLEGAGDVALRGVNRVRRRPAGRGTAELRRQLDTLRSVRLGLAGSVEVVAAALANWVLEVGCLAACALATGAGPLPAGLLLVVYAAGTAAGSASLLPSGIGVVDAALLAGLVGGGVPVGPAAATVLAYRLVSVAGVGLAGSAAWFRVRTLPILGDVPVACAPDAGRSGAESHRHW